MKLQELSFARQRKGLTQEQMAKVIGKSMDSYSKKERGEVKFSPNEIVAVTKELDLSYAQMNEIFFGGNLPFDK